MLIDNKTSRFLNGPYIMAGLVFLVPGLYALFQLQWTLFLPFLLISWFLFATYSGVQINTDKGIFREYNSWFGLVKTGNWKNTNDYLGLTLVPMQKVYRMFSRSNRSNVVRQNTFQICLVNQAKRPSFTLKICKTNNQAQKSIDELAIWMKLPVFSVKKTTKR